MISVVEGDGSDVASIMQVMHDAFDPLFGESWTESQCLAALAMPDCRLIIAKVNGTVVGFTMSRWVLDMEELLMIGVSADWQRQNIGSILLRTIITDAKIAGRSKLFLEVRDGNAAHDFYYASGFRPIGRRKQYYKGGNGVRPDAITMAMDL